MCACAQTVARDVPSHGWPIPFIWGVSPFKDRRICIMGLFRFRGFGVPLIIPTVVIGVKYLPGSVCEVCHGDDNWVVNDYSCAFVVNSPQEGSVALKLDSCKRSVRSHILDGCSGVNSIWPPTVL